MSKMKDSGVEWLGEIPESWTICKCKYLFSYTKQIVGNDVSNFERLALTLNGVIKRSKDDDNGLQPTDFSTYQILRTNQLVFKLIDLQNVSTSRVGLSSFDGIVSPAYIILEPSKSISSKFAEQYFLMLWHRQIFNQLGDAGVRSSLNSSDLLDVPFVLPPIDTQNNIVNFLDSKKIWIKSLTDNLNNQIDKLKEYKKALITKCVTKGLDPNVPLKDSGIDWIGEIPESWKISKIKNMYEVVLGKMLCDKPLDDTYTFENYICSQNIKYAGVNQTSVKKMWFNSNEKEQLFLCDGDVLISEGGNAGECCIYHNEFCPCYIQNAVHRVRGINDNLNKFLYYWLYALGTLGYFQMICNKATIRHYTREKVLETPIVCLTINGQKDIVNYLDKKCSEIDTLISSKQQQIDKLNEYQKSLIYEYVTGKKEVI